MSAPIVFSTSKPNALTPADLRMLAESWIPPELANGAQFRCVDGSNGRSILVHKDSGNVFGILSHTSTPINTASVWTTRVSPGRGLHCLRFLMSQAQLMLFTRLQ